MSVIWWIGLGGGTLGSMFVGLVRDPGAGWGLPDESAGRPRRHLPPIPWRLLLWVAALVVVFGVSRSIGGLAGYALMLAALAAGSLRLDRQLGPVARGLRDYQS
jgi:hypothetical protein